MPQDELTCINWWAQLHQRIKLRDDRLGVVRTNDVPVQSIHRSGTVRRSLTAPVPELNRNLVRLGLGGGLGESLHELLVPLICHCDRTSSNSDANGLTLAPLGEEEDSAIIRLEDPTPVGLGLVHLCCVARRHPYSLL